jgi:MarR family transcriptional regulator, multiple antibiotic resistance protein MarR
VADVYTAESLQPGGSVGYLINKVRLVLNAEVDRELEPLDITAAQFAIMAHLAFNLADSASALCSGMDYDPGAMTRMVDRLEAKGFIRRVRERGDRRKLRLELTEEGKAAFPKMKARVVVVLNRLLGDFSKAEAAKLREFLKRMLVNAEASA